MIKDNDWDIIFDQNINPTDTYSDDEIESLVNMLSSNRCNNYNDWKDVGLCLYNINHTYLRIWTNWSKKDCETVWKTFSEITPKPDINSLLSWCKTDNPEQYNSFIKIKKIKNIIVSSFPNDKLILGDTIIINDICSYTYLHNKKCLIKECRHPDLSDSMYVEILDKYMIIKCRHPECFGKTYPKEYKIIRS